MRLAFLSPVPPAPTGIADYSAMVLALLAGEHEIDVFHAQDEREVDRAALPSSCDVQPVSGFPRRHQEKPYDVAVYQMGNSHAHSFLYDHLSRVPGLLVLHDLVLHHSRAVHFLEAEEVVAWRLDPGSTAAREAARPSLDRWRQELVYTYPDRGDRLFEAHLHTSGRLLPYAYPLLRIPVEASRLVGVHSDYAIEAVEAEVPGARVARLVQPIEPLTVSAATIRERRRQLGIDPEEIVVGAFGLMTPEKRIGKIAEAVARAASWNNRVRLLLVGPVPNEDLLTEQLEALGVSERSIVTGRVPLEDLPVLIEVADIVVHLRYPTARETSAILLRVLAQGRPTVVADLLHQTEIPEDAVERVDVEDEVGGVTRAVAALAADRARREALGRRAGEYARQAYSDDRVRASWREALEAARSAPTPPPGPWPDHWPRP